MKKFLLFMTCFVMLACVSYADPHELPAGTKAWGGAGGWKSDINKIFNYFSATAGEPEAEPTIIGPLNITGSGDGWFSLPNNTTITDPITGLYLYTFMGGHPYTALNGTLKRLALYEELGGGTAPTIQADDPTIADATGEYIATTSGDRFYVVQGVGVQTIAGTWTGDETDPVIGTITPSALTHDGTGASLSATIASVTETNEEDREWSLYDVTSAAVEIDWSVFTGLSIATILIPADQHTYRVDARCTDLAGNVGTASSANIVYEAVGGALIEWDGTGSTLQTYVESSTITTTNSDFTSGYCYVDADGTANYACTDGQSIDLNKGTIEFTFVRRAIPDAYGVLFQMGTGHSDFCLRYYTNPGSDQYLQFRYGGTRLNFPIATFDATGIQTGTAYVCKLDWDNTTGAEIHNLTIGSATSAGTWALGSALGAKPTVGSNVMYIGTDNTSAYDSASEIRNWKVYDEVQ